LYGESSVSQQIYKIQDILGATIDFMDCSRNFWCFSGSWITGGVDQMRCQAASIENSVFGPGYQASQEQGLFSYGLLYSVFPLVQLGHGKKRENPSIWSFEPGFLIQTCVHSKSKACKRDKNCSIPCLDSYLGLYLNRGSLLEFDRRTKSDDQLTMDGY
jgi:hypothetical protein